MRRVPHGAGTSAPERQAARASTPDGRPWTVLCDFDGTVTLDDVTDSLLLRFARSGWEALEMQWLHGRIGSRQCMGTQIALLDCSREELNDHLSKVAIDPNFAAFAAALRRAGVPLRVVSDGLDVAIEAILSRHGIEGATVAASRLVQIGPRSWRLEFPHARSGCASATCKCAFAAPGCAVLVIGDGASDFCVAARADLVLAQKALLAHCRDEGLTHRGVASFADVLAAWGELSRPATELESGFDEEALDARS